jgi:hypothetical protein
MGCGLQAALGILSVLGVAAFQLNRGNRVRLKPLPSSKSQIELFSTYHKGAWVGLQSMHDYTDEKWGEQDEIDRTCTVTGVCLDGLGDSIDYFILRGANEKKEMGTIEKIASYENSEALLLGNTFVNTLAVGGPLINIKNNMLSVQFTFAEENSDRRMKVCIIYETYDMARIPGTSFEVPETMAISDVIIVREKRADPSLFKGGEVQLVDLEDRKVDDVMWSREGADRISDFEVEYQAGKRVQYDYEAGAVEVSESSFEEGSYIILEEGDVEEEFNLNLDAVDDPAGITSDVKIVHAGGLLLEAPRTLAAGEDSTITISWKRLDKAKMTVASVSFVAMQNAVPPVKRVKGGATAQYVQPQVTQIAVEELTL